MRVNWAKLIAILLACWLMAGSLFALAEPASDAPFSITIQLDTTVAQAGDTVTGRWLIDGAKQPYVYFGARWVLLDADGNALKTLALSENPSMDALSCTLEDGASAQLVITLIDADRRRSQTVSDPPVRIGEQETWLNAAEIDYVPDEYGVVSLPRPYIRDMAWFDENGSEGISFVAGAQFGAQPYTMTYHLYVDGTEAASGPVGYNPAVIRMNYLGRGRDAQYTVSLDVEDANGNRVRTISDGGLQVSSGELTTFGSGEASSPLTLVDSIRLSPEHLTQGVGATTSLIAEILPEAAHNSALRWFSSNPGVAAVDQWGNVIGIAEGQATITALAMDGSRAEGSCQVTVSAEAGPVESTATPEPALEPTQAPTPEPALEPTEAPTEEPTPEPTAAPTPEATQEPTEAPSLDPTAAPTAEVTQAPTQEPTEAPTQEPTQMPTAEPTHTPTPVPTEAPTRAPTPEPTATVRATAATGAAGTEATPTPPPANYGGTSAGRGPETGDEKNVFLWAAVMVLSLLCMGTIVRFKLALRQRR